MPQSATVAVGDTLVAKDSMDYAPKYESKVKFESLGYEVFWAGFPWSKCDFSVIQKLLKDDYVFYRDPDGYCFGGFCDGSGGFTIPGTYLFVDIGNDGNIDNTLCKLGYKLNITVLPVFTPTNQTGFFYNERRQWEGYCYNAPCQQYAEGYRQIHTDYYFSDDSKPIGVGYETTENLNPIGNTCNEYQLVTTGAVSFADDLIAGGNGPGDLVYDDSTFHVNKTVTAASVTPLTSDAVTIFQSGCDCGNYSLIYGLNSMTYIPSQCFSSCFATVHLVNSAGSNLFYFNVRTDRFKWFNLTSDYESYVGLPALGLPTTGQFKLTPMAVSDCPTSCANDLVVSCIVIGLSSFAWLF